MIEIMKTCHQEIEVTDMTGLKPSYGESYGMGGMAMASMGGFGGSAMAPSGSRSMARGGAMMSAAIPSGSVGMGCAMASASPAMSSEVDELERRLAMLGECDSMPMEKARDYESESREVFRSEAVEGLKGTVMKKQAKVRSAKMMI